MLHERRHSQQNDPEAGEHRGVDLDPHGWLHAAAVAADLPDAEALGVHWTPRTLYGDAALALGIAR